MKVKIKTKTLLTSLAVVLACPAFADNVTPDIAASDSTANCDSGVLHSTTGPTAFQAEWSANTININWFADSGTDSAISLTNSAAGTCTYDGAITLPTNTLSKTGYTFAGWQVRAPQCFAGVDASINVTHAYSRSYDSGDSACWRVSYDGVGSSSGTGECSKPEYNDLEPNEWKAEFSYGMVRGIASCQSAENIPADIAYLGSNLNKVVNGTADPYTVITEYTNLAGPEKGAILQQAFQLYQSGDGDAAMNLIYEKLYTINSTSYTKTNNTGQYCLCHVTSYTSNSDEICSPAASLWILNTSDVNSNCLSICASSCMGGIRDFSGYRSAIYGISQ